MPKEAKEAQEVENDLKVDTEANLRASELESSQEATQSNEQKADEKSEKGFFAKAVDKVKESTSEFFSADFIQEQKESNPTQATPKLKNAISKKTKLIDCLGYQYNGKEDFTLRVGSKVYVITQGEILIVPNGNTSRWLAHKSTLFTPVL